MIAQVTIGSDGEVTVTCDSDETADDETTTGLLGLAMDDLVDRAARTAITTWLTLRASDEFTHTDAQ